MDSDCIYIVDVDAYFGNDSDKTSKPELTSEYDGVYDLKFINKENESQKFVAIGLIKIKNGEISSDELFEQGEYATLPNEYSGFVTVENEVFLLGPSFDETGKGFGGECYFELYSFDENNVATGEVGCEGDRIINVGTVILEPTGSDIEGFTPVSFELSSNEEKTTGGGCLIATAAFGSELAPQVQMLREIRDNTLLQTKSGSAFMQGFNQFYYSFSPIVADYERENPVFKEAIKLTITPLITALSILNYVDIDSEAEMLGYGIGIILLNIGIYFVGPAFLIVKLKSRFGNIHA